MKKAIVTGHSRGLGAALAAQLEADGWTILGLSRSSGARVDLTDPAALRAWLASGALTDFLADATDILLINNAGTVMPVALVGDAEALDIERAVALNVTAPLLLADAVVEHRRDAQVRIVHISSGAARTPYAAWSTYCATKAAVDMHALALAEEALDGVRVASIAPGVVDTEMQASIRAIIFPGRDRFLALKEQGQLSSPDEAASQILSLVARDDFGDKVIADVRDAP